MIHTVWRKEFEEHKKQIQKKIKKIGEVRKHEDYRNIESHYRTSKRIEDIDKEILYINKEKKIVRVLMMVISVAAYLIITLDIFI